MHKVVTFILLACVLAVFSASPALAQDDDKAAEPEAAPQQESKPAKSNLPLNFYGRNGLFFANSTHVLDSLDVEPGVGYIYQSSAEPEYTSHTIAANVAFGLPKRVALHLHIPVVMTDLEYGERINAINVPVRDFSKKSKTDFGSIRGGVTWAFFQQDRFLPGMALDVTFIAPTGDYTQKISDVKYYGFDINFALSLEIIDLFFTDYAFAVFGDASLVLSDMLVEEQEYEEKHGVVHAGMLFPLHPRNFLNLIFEYEGVLMRGTTNDDDLSGFIGGFRFITNRIGVTAGAEYLITEAGDMDDAFRVIANGSYRFW